jgi:hypothetical protein
MDVLPLEATSKLQILFPKIDSTNVTDTKTSEVIHRAAIY